MEFTDFSSGFAIGGFSVSSIVDKIYLFAGLFLIILMFSGVLFAVYFILKRKISKDKEITISWWEEVGDRMKPSHRETVEEIVIPGTTLRIFFGKKRGSWIPRFTRLIDKNLYFVCKTKNGQIVNFEMPNLSSNLKFAEYEMDHSDMLWAAENAREYIKRNYRDKAKKWWDVYADKIAMAALMAIFTFCFVIIIYFMRGIVEDISAVAGSVQGMAEAAKATSGIVGS